MSILISHRGNLTGPNPELENSPSYVFEALGNGFQCEIDFWWKEFTTSECKAGLYLGHDKPQYRITEEFLNMPNLWVHAKNEEAVIFLREKKYINWFWHENDKLSITSHKIIWTGNEEVVKAASMSERLVRLALMIPDDSDVYAPTPMSPEFICSDYVELRRNKRI